MNKFKRFFNGRLFYSVAVGVLAVGIAATGAMLLGDQGAEDENQYLALEESAEQIVYGTTEAEEPESAGWLPETEAPTRAEAEEPAAAWPTEAEEPETEEPETEVSAEPETAAAEPESEQQEASEEEPEETAPPEEVSAPVFSEESTLSWPIHGSILREYSMDTTVFYPTLESYKVSPGILIQGEPGMEVHAAAAGVVKTIGSNEEIGNYMVVDLGGGYEATYGQLETVQAAAGDTVEAGQVLAVLAEPTKYYVVEGCNLYFEVTKDGSPVDPLQYLHE